LFRTCGQFFFQRWEINQEKKVTTSYVVLLLIWVFASFCVVGLKKKAKKLKSICNRERHVFKIPRAFDKPLPLQNHTPATV